MPDELWKAVEREHARRLGGKRAGPTGKDGPDILHDAFAPQCKQRDEVAQYLKEWMNQAVGDAPPDKLPMVIVHEKGGYYDEDLVIIRLVDFQAWYA
jgi:hypothetical protein